MAAKTVLISEPISHRQLTFLPYVWATLKSHCDRNGLASEVRWLDPIFDRDTPEALLAPYEDETPDVLGLSCYTWNWETQLGIAQRVKARYPRCLVVAGGPHPDYRSADFFARHPYLDAVAVKDGEITFRNILERVVEGCADLRDVRGLYLRDDDGRPVSTGEPEVPTKFDFSPYVDQTAYYERFVARFDPGRLLATLETNRGCPYSCNFCDWGSNTMSKVRQFDLERVEAEVDWLCRLGIEGIMVADANFGMFDRDLRIADCLNDLRTKHGGPRFVTYSPAKNHPDRTREIARRFAATGIASTFTVAIQHTRAEVLASADRSNIPVERQREAGQAIAALGIPTSVQLIVGLPGDTPEAWRSCLTDVMDWGLHDHYQIFNYALLPNAPAAEPEFRERWQLDTIRRWTPRTWGGERHPEEYDALFPVDILVASRSFTREDWIQMRAWAAFVRALHTTGLTRLIALYLHFSHGHTYREVYDAIIGEHFGSSPIYRRLEQHWHGFLGDEDAADDILVPEAAICLEATHWIYFQICRDFDNQFGALRRFLLDRFPGATNLEGAIDFQRHLVILPRGGPADAGTFRADHDWPQYLEKARSLAAYEPLGEPAPRPGATVEIHDEIRHRDWMQDDEPSRWREWHRLCRREDANQWTTAYHKVRLRVDGRSVVERSSETPLLPQEPMLSMAHDTQPSPAVRPRP